MRETTAEWLNPMLDATEANGITPEELSTMMAQSSMPAAEADTPFMDWMAKNVDGDGVRSSAIDWIRYGRLIRERLGWTDYPYCPADCPCEETPPFM